MTQANTAQPDKAPFSDGSGFSGAHIRCCTCDGHGQRSVWCFGVKEPDECPDCGGSGKNWRYPSGVIARYYGGPLLGKEPAALSPRSARHG